MKFNNVVEKLRKEFSGQDVSDDFNELEEQAGIAAQTCLQCLENDAWPIKIGKALNSLGFELWVKNFPDDSISGIMAINVDKDYPMVIGVNQKDSYEHQRFTLAHELAHYIFDVKDMTKENVSIQYYNTDIENNPCEFRANKFAAQLLLPEKKFRKEVAKAQRIYSEAATVVAEVAKVFAMPLTSVKRRMEELNIAS